VNAGDRGRERKSGSWGEKGGAVPFLKSGGKKGGGFLGLGIEFCEGGFINRKRKVFLVECGPNERKVA